MNKWIKYTLAGCLTVLGVSCSKEDPTEEEIMVMYGTIPVSYQEVDGQEAPSATDLPVRESFD